ncbi:MAG: HIT family protein [Candidatus Aenigmarchaeota archaeon]|nr:HIT family protein [Candidatus Aenigmarchaeota archaeon]
MNTENCLFCKIVRGEIPSKKIYEDDATVAFLDVSPAALGHTLVIPKAHFENIFDVDEATLYKLAGAVKKIAKNIKSHLNCDIMLLQNNGRHSGQIVDHAHFHVIPRKEGDGIRLSHARMQLSSEELEQIRRRLSMMK